MSTITFVVTRVLLISLLQTIVVEGLAASKNSGSPPPARLKQLLQSEMDGTRESDKPILLPCCYDGLTSRLVARAGFDATFMTGFGVSAANGACETVIILNSNLATLWSAVVSHIRCKFCSKYFEGFGFLSVFFCPRHYHYLLLSSLL
jgi:hypothetical protein